MEASTPYVILARSRKSLLSGAEWGPWRVSRCYKSAYERDRSLKAMLLRNARVSKWMEFKAGYRNWPKQEKTNGSRKERR